MQQLCPQVKQTGTVSWLNSRQQTGQLSSILTATAPDSNSGGLEAVMHHPTQLTFVDVQFHECYYDNRNDDNDPFFSTESEFNRCLAQFQPLISDPRRGDCLRVQEWTSARKPQDSVSKVLLQVFHIMPTWLDSHGIQKKDHFLHAMVVKPWAVREEDSFMGIWGKGRTHLARNALPLCPLLGPQSAHESHRQPPLQEGASRNPC